MRRANKYFHLTTLVLAVLVISGGTEAFADNSVTLGCPHSIDSPATETFINIPVYFTNDVALGGFTLGFDYNSSDIEIDSMHIDGTVVGVVGQNFFQQTYDPANNRLLIGWADFSFVNPIPAQTGGLIFTLVARVPAGAASQCVDIDSTFYPPAGEFIFSPQGGGQLTPDYFDCGTQEIEIAGGCSGPVVPPVAVCTDVTTAADANCEADVSVDNGSYDPEGQDVTLTQVPPAPYSAGVHTVKLIVTDSDLYADTCEATVTVQDNTFPEITCPGTIVKDNDPGECGAAVTFAATATDNCGIASITYSPASGTFFALGTTEVRAIATDNSGNADTCYFDVTVSDTEAPVASCPGDIIVDNDPGQCGAVVAFTIGASDNCEGATAVANPASGSTFGTGTTQVEVIATDAADNKDTCYFSVTVNDTEAPVAVCPADIIQANDAGQCGAAVTFAVSATDNCPGATAVANPASGSFFDLGTTTVEVIATDAAGLKDTCFFDVTINDEENPVVTCPGDTAIQLELGQDDIAVEYSASATDNCPGVTVALVPPSGSVFTYGETVVTATATDAVGNEDVCTFKVTIIPPNFPPQARDTAIAVDEDASVSGNMYAIDPESDALTFEVTDGPYNGALTAFDANTGAFTYEGDANFNGADSIKFVAKDLTNTSNTATVRITLNPINDDPVARDTSITTAEDTPVDGNLYGYDIDGDDLDFALGTGPDHGTITAFDAATGAFTYDPDDDYFGPDEFTFSVDDAKSVDGTVSITVTPVNDAPVAEDDAFSTDEDVTLMDDVTAADAELDALTYEIVDGATHGSASFADPADPTFTYVPDLNYNGGDSFTYRAYDGNLYSNVATISITVDPVNDDPVARDSSIIVVQNTPGAGQCQAYDVDGDPIYFDIFDGPYHGEITDFDDETGEFIYEPDTDYLGDDTLWFEVFEDKQGDQEGFVAIRVVEPAFFEFDPEDVEFTANEYDTNPDPITQEITSASPTGSDFDWRASLDASWLQLSDSSGTTPSTIDYIVDIDGLLPGTYEADVVFEVLLLASSLGAGPKDTVVVALTVENPISYDSVIVGNVIGEPGEEVMVPVYARASAPTKDINIPIHYDPSVLIYNYTDYFGTFFSDAELSSPHSEIDNVVQLRAGYHDGFWLAPSAGLVGHMSFTIRATASSGDVGNLTQPPIYPMEFILDADHASDTVEPVFVAGAVNVDIQSAADDNDLALPDEFSLDQNYPNPFNPETVIEYALPQAASVRLMVFNVLGQYVTTLVDEYQPAGRQRAVWDGRDANGVEVGSGIYFYRLTSDKFDLTRKMILMK